MLSIAVPSTPGPLGDSVEAFWSVVLSIHDPDSRGYPSNSGLLSAARKVGATRSQARGSVVKSMQPPPERQSVEQDVVTPAKISRVGTDEDCVNTAIANVFERADWPSMTSDELTRLLITSVKNEAIDERRKCQRHRELDTKYLAGEVPSVGIVSVPTTE